MSRSQISSTGNLKRNISIFGVSFVGIGIILHFAIPWFDFVQLIGGALGFAVEYPKAAAIPVAFLVLLFVVAAIDDRFRP